MTPKVDARQRAAPASRGRRGTAPRDDLHRGHGRFLSPQFVRLLGKTSIEDIRLGDKLEQVMTILFADIRDFTSLSEALSPRENFRFINA